ncbi:MAG: reverse transcriptase domain-containing protein, partial [Bacillota bacterium]|nr:reverse transcriptase domain-containing protein [Bacillota bacterium]
MTDNNEIQKNSREDYREMVKNIGKKEFTLMKMQEYGFWPEGLPTPFERQLNETYEEYEKRQELTNEYRKIVEEITAIYSQKEDIRKKLRELKKEYSQTWNIDKIRADVAQAIMRESRERRAQRKKQRELEKQTRSEEWIKKKAEKIIYIGKGYSDKLHELDLDETRLSAQGLPVIRTDSELAEILGIEYKKLRFLVYHRDVVSIDHYHHYTIPKRKGGLRNIAAPKTDLKGAQKAILEKILSKLDVSGSAHGFIKGKSVVSGAKAHIKQPELVINMDLENFFPTITFKRVLGMFKSFGYSGYIASLLAMLCTYCERMPIEVKGKTKYVVTSERILPQGSPASPMITNILCRKFDKRLNGLAEKLGFVYTRYADDMSFSSDSTLKDREGKLCGLVSKIAKEEGFIINKPKTRFLRKSNRQSITGIVINNDDLSVSKKWVRNFRAALFNAKKQKIEGSLTNSLRSEISGMAAWLKSVN